MATPPRTAGESEVELLDEDVAVDGDVLVEVVVTVVVTVVLRELDGEEVVDVIVDVLLAVVVAVPPSCIVSESGS